MYTRALLTSEIDLLPLRWSFHFWGGALTSEMEIHHFRGESSTPEVKPASTDHFIRKCAFTHLFRSKLLENVWDCVWRPRDATEAICLSKQLGTDHSHHRSSSHGAWRQHRSGHPTKMLFFTGMIIRVNYTTI